MSPLDTAVTSGPGNGLALLAVLAIVAVLAAMVLAPHAPADPHPVRSRLDHADLPPAPAPAAPGWHPDLTVGSMRWHDETGAPTGQVARWCD